MQLLSYIIYYTRSFIFFQIYSFGPFRGTRNLVNKNTIERDKTINIEAFVDNLYKEFRKIVL